MTSPIIQSGVRIDAALYSFICAARVLIIIRLYLSYILYEEKPLRLLYADIEHLAVYVPVFDLAGISAIAYAGGQDLGCNGRFVFLYDLTVHRYR